MLKGKIFSLGYHFYDESMDLLLFHENKTKKDFVEDVKIAMKEFVEKLSLDDEDMSFVSTSYLAREAYEILLRDGYKKFKPLSFDIFGSCIIDKEDKEVKKVLGAKLFKKVVDINKKIRQDFENF